MPRTTKPSTSQPPAVPVYLLAGGKSSRFHQDKARALVGGRPLILQVAQAAAALEQEITAVAQEPGTYQDLGLRTIGDPQAGKGPLAGLVAALKDRQARHGSGWILLLPCDWWGLQPAWLKRLVRHTDPVQKHPGKPGFGPGGWLGGGPGAGGPFPGKPAPGKAEPMEETSADAEPLVQAVAFRGQRWQPLLALYHTGVLPEATRRLSQGPLSLWRLLERVGAQALSLPEDWPRARQINRPEDLPQGPTAGQRDGSD